VTEHLTKLLETNLSAERKRTDTERRSNQEIDGEGADR
jgi:hypothetical protein